MAEHRIVIAGFGGQGVLFMGKIIANAGLLEGREVSWLPSYGPEMRGGTANCSVIVSDDMIGSPLITEPEILVAMNYPSYEKFIDSVTPGGKVLVDNSLVKLDNVRGDVELLSVPATKMAIDENLKGLANLIVLGKLFAHTHFSSYENLEQSIRKSIKANKMHLLEPNLRAIRMGMND